MGCADIARRRLIDLAAQGLAVSAASIQRGHVGLISATRTTRRAAATDSRTGALAGLGATGTLSTPDPIALADQR
jgi:hypothetical protein